MSNPGFHAGKSGRKKNLNNQKQTYGNMFITQDLVDKEDIYPNMDGPAVFKKAVIKFPEVIMEALDCQWSSDIRHQSAYHHTRPISVFRQFVQQQLGLREDQVHNNIQKYGNTTAASVPIALCEAWEIGKNKRRRSGLPCCIWQRVYMGQRFIKMVTIKFLFIPD